MAGSDPAIRIVSLTVTEGGYCIDPATVSGEIAFAGRFGIADAVPVTHENFRQWVIEDDFCACRPRLDAVGVTFSDEVCRFETMKLRILNGGHQVIAPPGELLGCKTIAEAMAHSAVHGLLRKVAGEEIIPHVTPAPGPAPREYFELICQRFGNPRTADTTRRVAHDGSNR